jgi:outer membrane protein
LLTQAARLDAEKNREDIVYNITNAYYNLFKLQQSKKVVVQNLQAIDREIKQAQRFFEQGLVTKNDVLRFQLQRSDVELTGVDLETNRKIMVYNLNILLGLPENNDISVEEVHPPDVQATPVTAYIDSAVANRQELKSLALHSRIADNNIKSIRADVKPTVLLSTSAYYINPSGALIPPVNRFVAPVTAGATVAWNFDQLWLNKNKLSEAKMQRIQVDISNTLQKDQVRTEVNQNYQNYLKALEKIRILETSLVQAQENNRMLESRYRNNVAPATDRIEAQTQLFQSQINLELARADAGIAYYTLLKSTGTLTRNK